MDKNTIVSKIEKYALIIGFISIFIGAWISVFNWISIAMFGLTYVTGFTKAYWKTGRIRIISLVLCIASLAWLVLRQLTDSPFLNLFAQLTLYAFLMDTQRTLLGHINRSFLIFAICAMTLGAVTAVYPSKVTNIANMLMQLWILFRFLDPILEQIGQAHRAKRLAALAEEEKKKEVESSCEITENCQ